MKKIARKILSFIMTFCCALPISACKNKADNNSGTSSCVHTYTSVTTKQPTCKETGEKTYTCNICGNSYTEDIAKLTTHSYTSTVTKEATCKETGVRTYTCSTCGDSYTEDIAKLTTHSYTSTVTKEATCAETGVRTYTCSTCGDSYTSTISKTNDHSWNAATCMSPKTCTTCEVTSGNINEYLHSGQKVCTDCGVNYHGVLANYIQNYGTYSNDKAIIKGKIYINSVSYTISLEYVFSSGGIIFGVDAEFSLSVPNDLSGEYNYVYLVMNLDANIIDSMSGTLIAKDITSTTTNLPYTEFSSFQNKHTNTYMQAQAAKYLKVLLTALNTIFDEAKLGIGTKHFGFTNYPSNGD